MRNEMIGAVVRRALEHPEFRRHLLADPEVALSQHGFALESNEMDEIRRIRGEMMRHESQDVEQRLRSIAEEYGVRPGS
ncbi:MAG: hypothetical protein WBX15_16150 [Thermoanaerobaculia bacterium]